MSHPVSPNSKINRQKKNLKSAKIQGSYKKQLMRKMGLEPTRYCYHKILSLARLPVPTLPHAIFNAFTHYAPRKYHISISSHKSQQIFEKICTITPPGSESSLRKAVYSARYIFKPPSIRDTVSSRLLLPSR